MVKFKKLRKDFPIFERKIRGKPLIYFDNGASSQKPIPVIKEISDFYAYNYSNIHRGPYQLSEKATEKYEKVREKIVKFIGAESFQEIVFTKGATEAINLVAYSWGEKNLKKGDNIITTIMEHHSNFVPWQILAKKKKVELKVLNLRKQGKLDLSQLNKLVNKKTKLITLTHASNVLGTINPIGKISKIVRSKNPTSKILLDVTQTAPKIPIDVKKLGCDFLAFSGHKMLGPTGVGVLYGKKEILEKMPPFLTGGGTIKEVSTKKVSFNDLPWKFEAGTANIAQVIGLGKAIDYLNKIGLRNIKKYEEGLTHYLLKGLKEIKGIEIYGPQKPKERVGLISFNIDGIHPHDLATLMDNYNIAVRAGHHCAMPLHKEVLQVNASLRVSFYLYNTKEEIDKFIIALKKAQKLLGVRPL